MNRERFELAAARWKTFGLDIGFGLLDETAPACAMAARESADCRYEHGAGDMWDATSIAPFDFDNFSIVGFEILEE